MKTLIPGFALYLLITLAATNPVSATDKPPPLCNDTSWFINAQTPPALLINVFQAATFPEPGNGTCQFHEFAWQNFLAITLGDSPAFESWPTSRRALPAQGQPQCHASPLGSALTHHLPKHPVVGSIGDIQEAAGGPLVDQNGRYVQYEIRINPASCDFIRQCQLYKTACVTAATQNPSVRFPVQQGPNAGTLSIKTAWRVMETCDLPDSPKTHCHKDDLSRYFWIQADTVQPFSPAHQGSVSHVKLGLVGFHLVQKTAVHPEMVWATWEHVNNAPVCPSEAQTSSARFCEDPSQAGKHGWSFYNPGCTGDYCALNTPYYDETQPGTQPISQVCRQNACGGGSEKTLPAQYKNQKNIAALNAAIRPQLAGTPWENYFLVGTLWTRDNKNITVPRATSGTAYSAPIVINADSEEKLHAPVAPLKCARWNTDTPPECLLEAYDPTVGNENGSQLLSNTTMETWTQWIVGSEENSTGKPKHQTSCFAGCHQEKNNGYPGAFANIDFTHFLIRAQQDKPTSCPIDVGKCASQFNATPAK